MNDPAPLPRSPELMNRDDTALLVVDVQDKLLPWIPEHRLIVWNIRRLIEGAQLLGLPVEATEQYPEGLGPTTAQLAERLGTIPAKRRFSCGECGELFARIRQRGANKILLAGIECHVCVQQTAFDLLADGFRVYLAVDAVGSRRRIDYETALRRMESGGVALTTTEAALFEWCATAAAPEFRQLSALVRQAPPEDR